MDIISKNEKVLLLGFKLVSFVGLALGIGVSGSGLGGLILSPLTRYLINSYGWHMAIRVIGAVGGGFSFLISFLLKPNPNRLVDSPSKHFMDVIRTMFVDRRFNCLYVFGFFVTFGYQIPFYYLPSYAVEKCNLTSTEGALILGFLSAGSAVGRIVLGIFSDNYGHLNSLLISVLITSLSTLVMWPFSTTFWSLLSYAVVYGIFSGGFVSGVPLVIMSFFGSSPDISAIMGLMYSSYFCGVLFGTPLSGLVTELLAVHNSSGETPSREINYLPAIYFSGGVIMLGNFFLIYLKYFVGKGKFFFIV